MDTFAATSVFLVVVEFLEEALNTLLSFACESFPLDTFSVVTFGTSPCSVVPVVDKGDTVFSANSVSPEFELEPEPSKHTPTVLR